MPQCILKHVYVNIYIYEAYTDGCADICVNTNKGFNTRTTEKKQQKAERRQTNTKCETNIIKQKKQSTDTKSAFWHIFLPILTFENTNGATCNVFRLHAHRHTCTQTLR